MINEYLYKTKNIPNGELNEHCFQTINIFIVIDWNIPYDILFLNHEVETFMKKSSIKFNLADVLHDGTNSCILRD